MNLLTIENLTKSYGERYLLNDTFFSLNEGEKVGVLGINGTGKSTLLKILAGKEEADQGKMTIGNNLKISYLPQKPEFKKGATILEAAIEGNVTDDNKWAMEAEAKSMLNELDLFTYDTPVDVLSGGQKKRVALVNVLLAGGDILILDEPTNHLDSYMAAWLEEFLIRFRGAVILVTHDRYFLDRIVTRIVEIDKGIIYSYPGSYSEFVRLKAERQNMELAAERKRQSILRTELQWLMRGARARSTKQKAHIQRIEKMQEIKGPQEEAQIEMSSLSSRMGRKTIEVNNISKSYGDKLLFSDYTYIFLKNDRIGIVGKNGCGKSTLLKVITQKVLPDTGSIETGSTIKIAYFSQENEEMDDRLKAIDYVREGAEYIKTKDGVITASAMLERFLFDGEKQWTKIEKLSGGEKRRLYLLRLLMEAPNVLILDEPTNDLDIQTLTVLEDYLDEFDGIVITVSHDRYFLDRIVKRIFAFESGQIKQYEGGYSDYDIASTAREMNDKADNATEIQKSNELNYKQKPREKKLKMTFKEEREAETIDDDIAALEEKIEELEKESLKYASDFVKLNKLMKEKEEAEAQLEYKMERWVYLNELREKIENQ